jgi:hypothetical protein
VPVDLVQRNAHEFRRHFVRRTSRHQQPREQRRDTVRETAQYGSGTLRLTGKNTFTGFTNNAYHVELLGGTLIADYVCDTRRSRQQPSFPCQRTLYYDNGHLEILGKTGSGNTTWQAFGTNTVYNATRSNVLTVDGNGGDGTTVQLGPVDMQNSYSFLLFERLGNASVRTAEAILPTPPRSASPTDWSCVRTAPAPTSGQRSGRIRGLRGTERRP